MAYRVKLSTRAEGTFKRLKPEHQQLVGDWILDLMNDPHGLGRKVVSPPFPPGGLMINFEDTTSSEDFTFSFTIFYTIDEKGQVVQLSAIGFAEHPRESDWP